MLRKPCNEQPPGAAPAPQRVTTGTRVRTCNQRSAVIVALRGVVVGVDDATLALFARFGLAATGEPLLEPKRGST